MFNNPSQPNSTVQFGKITLSSFSFFILVAALVILAHAVMVLFEPYQDYDAFVVYVITLVVFGIALILQKKQHIRTAKLLPILAFNFLVFYLSYHLGIRSGAILYYFPYIVSFLYIFRNEQSDFRTILYFILSVVNLVIILSVCPVHSDHFRLSEELLNLVQHRAILVSFLLTTLFVFVIYSFQGQLLQTVHEHEKNKRRAILRSIIETQESERAAIVSSLRDSVSQTLNAARLVVEDITKKSAFSNENELVNSSTRKAVEELDNLCNELLPTSLLDISCEEGIREYLENFSQNNDKTVWLEDIDAIIDTVSNLDKLGLLRIIQDYLILHKNNPKSSEISISVNYSGRIIKLTFTQNDPEYNFIFLRHNAELINLNSRLEYYNGIMRQVKHLDGLQTIIEIPLFFPAQST